MLTKLEPTGKDYLYLSSSSMMERSLLLLIVTLCLSPGLYKGAGIQAVVQNTMESKIIKIPLHFVNNGKTCALKIHSQGRFANKNKKARKNKVNCAQPWMCHMTYLFS